MFNRRVASSCGIPQHMWRSLHIMSQRQASHVLPPLVALSSQRFVIPANGGMISTLGMGFLASMSSETMAALSSMTLTPQSLLQVLSSNPVFMQLLGDTMCCCSYVVVEHMASAIQSAAPK